MEAHERKRTPRPAPEPIPITSLEDPSLYFNRELSRVWFYFRVLDQARDANVPLLERVRFLTISSAILDEFFEIRVAGLEEQVAMGISKPGADGLTATATLEQIRTLVVRLVAEQYETLDQELLPALRDEGIDVRFADRWTKAEVEWLRRYFDAEVLPVLTPVGLDPAHPFPKILNKSLNFLVTLEGKDAFGRRGGRAVIQAPRLLPRLVRVPDDVSHDATVIVPLVSIIEAFVGELFPGMKVRDCHQFRVTRNSDLWIEEEEVDDLLSALQGELAGRHYAHAVRLEVDAEIGDDVLEFLCSRFQLHEADVYRVEGPVNLSRFSSLLDLVDRPALKYPPFKPGLPGKLNARSKDLFSIIRDRDLLLHHPYQSFAPVLELLHEAARDPNVLAIKQTVYRTGMASAVGRALLEAARAGKEVTAVVELRARFDEAANIKLASDLQEAGAKVVYGVVGFKAHGKMLMIVRREGDRLRRYVHLGTGNYNDVTARQYTDFSLITADDEIGEDTHALFQQLTGLGKVRRLKKLHQTPFGLHDTLLERIELEIEEANAGRPARIAAKMNSLIETDIIRALYRASRAGVQVDLVVRGICCLRPGVPGVSENIRVRSVLGRFLEHHRVFHFHAAGEKVIMCSSADWMPRNFFKRVEVAFPIEARKLKRRLIDEGLDVYFRDNCQAYEMGAEGQYTREDPGAEPRWSAQESLLDALADWT